MYDHKQIEKKWQDYWLENKTFKVELDKSKPKYYILDMFPYPSWAGLHVGHPEGYTATDIISRYKVANGYNVMHPMGWDRFGLPAENYAIKTGTHPEITTAQNIKSFKDQINSLGFSYDWDREINTTDPNYYKWTQWIFLKLFEVWLAYEQDLPINFCPSCKTGLANEEVLNDGTCERCGTKVIKKKIRQWVLAITKYRDRLASDVEDLDWPEGIKAMQRDWIGRSEWVEFELKKSGDDDASIRVYTTRIDTVFGMTYRVIAPDHTDVDKFITPDQKSDAKKYIEDAKSKSDLDRTSFKQKTWVWTGSYLLNPFNNKKIPLYIGDYVLWNYGTGAVMAVPAHDDRDYDFARAHDLEILEVIKDKTFGWYGDGYWDWHWNGDLSKNPWVLFSWNEIIFDDKVSLREDIPFVEDGVLVDSWDFSGLDSKIARQKMSEYLENNNIWTKKTNYKLRDWLFSRQRYWWEPIPLIHLDREVVKSLPRIYSLDEALNDNMAYVLKTEVWSDFREIELWGDWVENTSKLESEACLSGSAASSATNNFDVFSTGNPDPRTLCSRWQIKSLVINWRVVSKIYSWLYSDIIIDYNLPIELPEVDKYEPSDDGESPLSRNDDFVNVKLASNLSGQREVNTMPQWWGSCWYYLRYLDPHNNDMLIDPEIERYWQNVDSYVWWREHAVLHLLYARFWHKFLYDIWVVSTKEPFQKLRNQWLVLAYSYQTSNGQLIPNDLVEVRWDKYYHIETWVELSQVIAKMSKSLKNVVNPNDIVDEYGADSLRLYEMYMWEFRDSIPWDTKNIIGVRRFLDRVHNMYENSKIADDDTESMKLLHKTIKKVWHDIEEFKFNTAISSLMILSNYGHPKGEELKKQWLETFAKLLHPFAPHMGEELWSMLWYTSSIYHTKWPNYDESMTIDDTLTIPVQISGKVRTEITISADTSKDEVLSMAKSDETIKKYLEWVDIIKEIYVPKKIVNIVVK